MKYSKWIHEKVRILKKKQVRFSIYRSLKSNNLNNLTGYDDICEFTRLVNLMQLMWNERNHSICYTATTYEVHTFKNKNKRKSLRDTFIYHFLLFSLFIRSCKFVIIETCSYDMMRTRGAHLSFKVYIRVRSKAVTSVL